MKYEQGELGEDSFDSRLSSILYRIKYGEDISRADLALVYNPPVEIRNVVDEGSIHHRLLEVRSLRDNREDLANLYGCNRGEVALLPQDVNNRTVVLLPSINLHLRRMMFKNLQYILGDASFYGAQFKEFESLLYIGGNVDFENANIQNLGSLLSIGGNVKFNSSNISNLGNLCFIGGDVYCVNPRRKPLKTQIRTLDERQCIGGRIYFKESD